MIQLLKFLGRNIRDEFAVLVLDHVLPNYLVVHHNSQVMGGQIEKYQKEIVELKADAAEEKKKRQTMENLLRFLMQWQGDDLPPEIASEMDALGSGTTVSQTRPSSDNPDLLSPREVMHIF
ncbi:hypothetical protein PIB30_014043 [Stylosanthes scabra]|uniref:Uncharacterized protein n=1 Tax=Stylosanthes scabra TaxID=79078 RepID=A0ABU6Z474_9FABA|nr:hypothetical protein [Stylosanthes scabra]